MRHRLVAYTTSSAIECGTHASLDAAHTAAQDILSRGYLEQLSKRPGTLRVWGARAIRCVDIIEDVGEDL